MVEVTDEKTKKVDAFRIRLTCFALVLLLAVVSLFQDVPEQGDL